MIEISLRQTVVIMITASSIMFVGFLFGYVSFPLALIGVTLLGVLTISKGFRI